MDRAPASLSSLPRRPGLRTSARHPGRRGPLHAIPRSVVDRVTSLERGIGQQRPADDELVIKLSEVGAAAHLQSLERPRQAQFPVPTAVFRTSGDRIAARPPPAGGSAVGRGLPRCVTSRVHRDGTLAVRGLIRLRARAGRTCPPVSATKIGEESRIADRVVVPTASSPRRGRPRRSPRPEMRAAGPSRAGRSGVARALHLPSVILHRSIPPVRAFENLRIAASARSGGRARTAPTAAVQVRARGGEGVAAPAEPTAKP